MIANCQVRLPLTEAKAAARLEDFVGSKLGETALRWYVAQITDTELVIEVTFDDAMTGWPQPAPVFAPAAPVDVVVSIIPTGVGCTVGAYAGDAAPASSLLAAACDVLITNPNAVNASNFIRLDDNVLYTEGSCIDLLMQGRANLYRSRSNKVGLIVEKTTKENLDIVYNVVNTARAVFGVNIVAITVTAGPIGSHCVKNESGAFVGTIDHPDEIIKATEILLSKGADAIAITTNIHDLPHDAYVKHFEGNYPNPLGGVEAIISHLVVNRFGVPAAHAPMINLKALELVHAVVDARGAGEISSVSGLCCILIGLAKAPQVSLDRGPRVAGGAITLADIVAVVAPAGCLGGIPTLFAQRHNIPVIAVEDNKTILRVDARALALDGVVTARSYAEAAGLILAIRRGLSIDTVSRPMATLRHEHVTEQFVAGMKGGA